MKYYIFLIVIIILSCENKKNVERIELNTFQDKFLVYKDVLIDFENSLKQVIFDTLYIKSNDKVVSKFYCTFDIAYLMPKEYIWDSTINQFYVYDKVIELNYFRNNKLIFDTIIDKYYFKDGFNKKQLKDDFDYLIISDVYFKQKDSIKYLNINLNIPITDIGYLKEIDLNKLIGF